MIITIKGKHIYIPQELIDEYNLHASIPLSEDHILGYIETEKDCRDEDSLSKKWNEMSEEDIAQIVIKCLKEEITIYTSDEGWTVK